MTGRRWRAAVAVGGLLVLTACTPSTDPTQEDRSTPAPSTADALPGLPTGASTGLPAYEGPPADAPPSAGPVLTVRASVPLTATPRVAAEAQAAVASADGGAYVVLTPADDDEPQRLVTIGGPDDDYAITRSVPMPRVVDVWGMHVMADGAVVVVGHLADVRGYGALVLDPVTGTGRTDVAVPASDGTMLADGASTLSGSQLYLFVTVETGAGPLERLATVDLGSDRPPTVRNLVEDVARASRFPIGRQFGGLVARPGGGVTLAFDASPTEAAQDRIPTLLTFDAQLQPVGEPARATDLAEGAEIQSVTGAADGTVFLLVEVRDATWVLAVPDGGGAGPVLAQLDDRLYDYSLSVEPAQVWGLLPSAQGVRAIDLTTGEVEPPLRLGCAAHLDVWRLLPGADGTGAVVMGDCDDPWEDTQMLWLVGP